MVVTVQAYHSFTTSSILQKDKGADMRGFAVLGSSSKANAYALQSQDAVLLIDNGFSCRELLRRLDSMGAQPAQVCAVLVTHNHIDHTRGVPLLAKKLGIPVYLPRPMTRVLPWKDLAVKPTDPEEEFMVGPFRVLPFRTYHDTDASVGYSIACEDLRITIITDTGRTDERMAEIAGVSDLLCVETNYCEHLLASGRYPPFLKRRIASSAGHLSNSDALALLQQLDEVTQFIFLCHLSGENNSPETVRELLDHHQVPCRDRTVICRRGEMYLQQLMDVKTRRNTGL